MKRIICLLLLAFLIFPTLCQSVCAQELPFRDVKSTAWYYNTVQKAYDLGIMNGISAEKFDPNGKLTREQAAMLLYNLEGKGASYSRYSFSDVKAGSWYANAVEWLYKKGVTQGVSSDKFGVGMYITRQDFVTMIHRLYGERWDGIMYIRDDHIKSFKDYASISEYALPSMKLFTGLCMVVTPLPLHLNVSPILNGSNGRIYPKDNCTRAEAAQILCRVYSINSFI